MGILYKIVFILHKIDPDNKYWKEKLFEATPVAFHNELEKSIVVQALEMTAWNKSAAARLLGLTRARFRTLMNLVES
jgi:transcriptional regulator with GAF, ATPase, and Fis domain